MRLKAECIAYSARIGHVDMFLFNPDGETAQWLNTVAEQTRIVAFELHDKTAADTTRLVTLSGPFSINRTMKYNSTANVYLLHLKREVVRRTR